MALLTRLKTVFTKFEEASSPSLRFFDPQQKLFASCPDTPNCVSTQAPSEDKVHYMEPIPYTGLGETIHKRLLATIEAMPGSTVKVNAPDYIRAEFRSRIFHFVDDVEVYLDEMQQLIHFRSASRLGESDLGVNRRRMNAIGQHLGKEQ